ncbi:hypothetical protein [Streptomyces sp. NPDC002790]
MAFKEVLDERDQRRRAAYDRLAERGARGGLDRLSGDREARKAARRRTTA